MDQPPSVPPPSLPGPPPIPSPRRRVAAWRWWIHLLVIGSYPLLIGLISETQSAASTEVTGPALGSSTPELLMVSAITMATFGIIFGLGWLFSRASAEDLRLHWRQGWLSIPLGFGYSIALRIMAGIGVGIVVMFLLFTGQVKDEEMSGFLDKNRPEVEKVVNIHSLSDDPAYYILSLTLVSFVVAGLREELWRSSTLAAIENLFPRLSNTWQGKAGAIVITAAIFGIGHIPQGWLAVLLTGVLGLGLGTIIMVHRSMWTAVLAHGFFDAASLAVMPWIPELLEKARQMVPH